MSPESIEIQLKRIPLFSGLDLESRTLLAARCRRRRFEPKEAIFREGDTGETLYLIVTGHVNIEQIRGERPVHIARRGPGEYFGDMALWEDQPRSADAIADRNCELLMLDRRDLVRFLESHPGAAWSIIKTLSARLRQASERMTRSETSDALRRLACLLREECTGATPDGRGAIHLARITDDSIANRVGTTRETVNRRLSHLRRMGVLCRDRGALVILDPGKLQELCAE